MNAGVSTSPYGVWNRPARARSSCASSSKEKLMRIVPIVFPDEAASDDRHRVTVRIEAISLGDRLAIRGHRELVSGERSHEHDECGAGQMKVRDQMVDRPKAVARPDEDSRLAGCGGDVSGVVGDALERAHGGRPHRPD